MEQEQDAMKRMKEDKLRDYTLRANIKISKKMLVKSGDNALRGKGKINKTTEKKFSSDFLNFIVTHLRKEAFKDFP